MVSPTRFFGRYLAGMATDAEKKAKEDELDIELDDSRSPTAAGILLEVYGEDPAKKAEDKAELVEALMFAVDEDLGDIAKKIIDALHRVYELPDAGENPNAQEGEAESEDPKPPSGAARRRTRRRKVSRRKTKSSRR
jgi:hypothetical protein